MRISAKVEMRYSQRQMVAMSVSKHKAGRRGNSISNCHFNSIQGISQPNLTCLYTYRNQSFLRINSPLSKHRSDPDMVALLCQHLHGSKYQGKDEPYNDVITSKEVSVSFFSLQEKIKSIMSIQGSSNSYGDLT